MSSGAIAQMLCYLTEHVLSEYLLVEFGCYRCTRCGREVTIGGHYRVGP